MNDRNPIEEYNEISRCKNIFTAALLKLPQVFKWHQYIVKLVL